MTRPCISITSFLVICQSLGPALADDPKPPVRTISVSGTAKVNVVPDEVVLTIGVEARNAKLDVAKKEVDAGIQKAIAVAKDSGIEAKDVQTDRLELRPEYEDREFAQQYSGKLPKLLGYFAHNRISITLRDVSKREDLITALLKAGINSIESVDFQTSKLREYRDQARLMAIRAAKEKAELMARELGMKVGKPVTITEQSYPSYYAGRSNRLSNVQQTVAEVPSAASEDGGTVALGQIGVSATVQIIFELVDTGS